jgi:hypothetical protein
MKRLLYLKIRNYSPFISAVYLTIFAEREPSAREPGSQGIPPTEFKAFVS